MRITTSTAKVTFVVAWLILGLALNVILIGAKHEFLVAASFAFTLVFLVVGVRAFRGSGEQVNPPRAWWRATATRRSSFSLGALFLGLSVLGSIAALEGSVSLSSPFFNVPVLVLCFAAGIFYLHSGWKMREGFGVEKGPRERTPPR